MKRRTVLLAAALLASCGSPEVRDSGPPAGSAAIPDLPGSAVPKPEPRSRYGNGPVYEVLGKTYSVLPSGDHYSERGVASWYGQKFHGRLTSNRETYDMYSMTAAHRTLPLPTYVRVRNLRNNKSVVVRVNDRGPFVHNRIIDLSYAAALKLDMIADGTSLVEVTALSVDGPVAGPVAGSGVDRTVRQPASRPGSTAAPAESFVQVGAFGDRGNADRRKALLEQNGIDGVRIHTEPGVTPALYRVRIGPILEVVQYDVIVAQLERLGITDPYLVPE